MRTVGAPEPVDDVNVAFLRSVGRMLGFDISDPRTRVIKIEMTPDEVVVWYVDTAAFGPEGQALEKRLPVRRAEWYG